MTPEFSKRAARVMNSVYWSVEYDDDFDQRIEEKFRFRDAMTSGKIQSYADLSGETKESFDRAEAAQDELDVRLGEGYSRFHADAV